ncbi:hypothetical protein RB195_023948 [Necator americanus]|uniref:CTLH domain-containing protein n=1 Tax=Necator americanus TaxID=51031 RepID=A0ABR1EL85_NECAM
MQRLEEAIGAVDAATSKIEQGVGQDYAAEFAKLTQPAEKDQENFGEYSAKAELSLTSALDYSLLLKARARTFKSYGNMSPLMSGTSTSHAQSQECATATTTQPKRIELPTLPIPIFRGNIWEWDNFWELFNTNVHSQDLPELFKFNYLLNALKGEALESVKKFQINKENYSKALEFLHHKYGNAEELVNRLINKLENCSLRSPSLRDKRTLFEQLQVIVTQLRQKGEYVDSRLLLKQVLSKFPDSIQRKVLLKKQSLSFDTLFCMEIFLNILEEIIASEEMVSLYLNKTPKVFCLFQQEVRSDRKSFEPSSPPLRSCMYCGDNHKPWNCLKYKTHKERSQYL